MYMPTTNPGVMGIINVVVSTATPVPIKLDLQLVKVVTSGRESTRDTRSWFTVSGWKKYSGILFEMFAQYKMRWNKKQIGYRVITADTDSLPGKIISRGKIQAVEDLTGVDTDAA